MYFGIIYYTMPILYVFTYTIDAACYTKHLKLYSKKYFKVPTQGSSK